MGAAPESGEAGSRSQGVQIGDHNVQHNYFHAAGPARSTYRHQVERIAPHTLEGRDGELADLAAFATGTAGQYVMWQAPAWAGKTALLSWFALRPPAGVRVVPFFISASLAEQDGRIAFTEFVIEQLAELLDEPAPAITEPKRDTLFLDLLDRAGERCARQERRLVLLVDGLDEDLALATDLHTPSIAALLPRRPHANVRVIVASRPNPPLPDDVPRDHPLRDPSVVRTLTSSPAAAVIRHDLIRDLKVLLGGAGPGRDVLGLLAAARGALTGRDLAELTGRPDWELAELLGSRAGRLFLAQPSRWRVGQDTEVYVFSHDALRTTAIERIGPGHLTESQDRIHAWADRYRGEGWPQETPVYLLSGYGALLLTTGDATRLVERGVDRVLHDRVLVATGGDHLTMTEIDATARLLTAGVEVDLDAVGRLAAHQAFLRRRGTRIPVELAAAWASLGEFDRAEVLARSITDQEERERALCEVVSALAKDAGSLEKARLVAGSIRGAHAKGRALMEITRALVESGQYRAAEDTARSIGAPALRTAALGILVRDLADRSAWPQADALVDALDEPTQREWILVDLVGKAGAADLERAGRFLRSIGPSEYMNTRRAAKKEMARALVAADRVQDAGRLADEFGENPFRFSAMLADVAEIVADAGRVDDALHMTETIPDPVARGRALGSIARSLAVQGECRRAEHVTRRIPDLQPVESNALSQVAIAMAQHGDPIRAERMARRITEADVRAGTFGVLALVSALSGNTGHAETLTGEAETAANLLKGAHREFALLGVAVACVHAHAGDRADAIVESLRPLSIHPNQQTDALRALAGAYATAGQVGQAEAAVREHSEPAMHAALLAQLAEHHATQGDRQVAEQLAVRAEQLARSAAVPYWHVPALINLARSLAGTSERAFSAALLDAIPDHQIRDADLDDLAGLQASIAHALVALGRLDEAADVAKGIRRPQERADALTALATAYATAGAFTEAIAAARSCPDEGPREEALVRVFDIAASVRRTDVAVEAATAISDTVRRSELLGAVVDSLVSTGDLPAATRLAATIAHPQTRIEATSAIVRTHVLAGDQHLAEALLATIESHPERARVTIAVAAAMVALDRLDLAEETAGSFADPSLQAAAFRQLARAADERGAAGHARRWAERATAVERFAMPRSAGDTRPRRPRQPRRPVAARPPVTTAPAPEEAPDADPRTAGRQAAEALLAFDGSGPVTAAAALDPRAVRRMAEELLRVAAPELLPLVAGIA
ncbi:hypothetical protein [Dactylosporangium maewongense]